MLNDIYQGLDPIAFSLGPLVVRWYGLAYVLGFVCAAAIIYFVAKRWKLGMSEDNLLTLMVCAIVGVVLGARIGYVLFYGDGYYLQHPEEILAFNHGGMSFHGGLVGALLAGLVAAKITRLPYLPLADMAVIGAPLGLFFGRCANFVNGELWGAPTDLPWGVVFGGAAGEVMRHPSQLYEAVLVEFVRLPDSQIGYLWGDWLTMGQLLSLPLVAVGIGVLAYACVRKLPQQGLPEPVGAPEHDDSEANL